MSSREIHSITRVIFVLIIRPFDAYEIWCLWMLFRALHRTRPLCHTSIALYRQDLISNERIDDWVIVTSERTLEKKLNNKHQPRKIGKGKKTQQQQQKHCGQIWKRLFVCTIEMAWTRKKELEIIFCSRYSFPMCDNGHMTDFKANYCVVDAILISIFS